MRKTIYISGRVSGTSDARERFRRVEQRIAVDLDLDIVMEEQGQ